MLRLDGPANPTYATGGFIFHLIYRDLPMGQKMLVRYGNTALLQFQQAQKRSHKQLGMNIDVDLGRRCCRITLRLGGPANPTYATFPRGV